MQHRFIILNNEITTVIKLRHTRNKHIKGIAMNNIKSIIAQNITDLRRAKGLTQLELAEQLNYSDKAVSKWERAESMPDVSVLVDIADLFDVPLDYLVRTEHPQKEIQPSENALSSNEASSYRKEYISGVAILLVWLIAVLVFVIITLSVKDAHSQWLSFIYAIPVSAIVWLVFNSIWFNPRLNYFIVSLLMWSFFLSIQLTLFSLGINAWLIYLLGIPGQIIIILWALIKKPRKQEKLS